MKHIYIAFAAALLTLTLMSAKAYSQKFKSNSSTVHFFSDAPVEDIEAKNIDGQSALDIDKGDIVFSIPIKSFVFEKSLMQEHFNENYMESDKYPKATFIGKVTGYNSEVTTFQNATAKGKMKIHGIEHDIEAEGQLRFNADTIELSAKFPIKLEDYKIKIPKVVFYNIAEIVEVTIKFKYEKIE